MHRLVGLVALASLLAVHGAAAQTQGASKQAIYDLAQAAYDKADWASAAAGFIALLPGDDATALSRSGSVIAYRYADSLVHLRRRDEAARWVKRALPGFPREDPAAYAEVLVLLGEIKRLEYDYPAAMSAFDQAEAILAGHQAADVLLRARIGFAYAGMTVDPLAVSQKVQELAKSPDFAAASTAMLRAQLEDLQARAALNLGDTKTAERLITSAVSDSGGLGKRVTTTQVAIRADAGVISHLAGHDGASRKYFAYTGAGHLPDMTWIGARSGDPPLCGTEGDDPHPDDSVVIDLAIGDDGRVVGALPVYASRVGSIGETFARAVSTWQWDPDKIKNVDPFFRANLQLELKCAFRPSPENLDAALWSALTPWLRERGLLNKDGGTGASGAYKGVRADDPRLFRPGGATLRAVAAPLGKTMTLGKDAKAFEDLWKGLDDERAPSAAYVILIERLTPAAGVGWYSLASGQQAIAQAYVPLIARFERQFPGDPAVKYLLLREAFAWEGAGMFAKAQPLLLSILAGGDENGSVDAPLRPIALLHRAIGLDRAGEGALAQETLQRSGLTSDQCSLFDTHPVREEREQDYARFYPEGALNWGFEGYIQYSFDISSDGGVKNFRSVVSYPPYMFSDATERVTRTYRFVPPRLGGAVVGCEGRLQSLTFNLRSEPTQPSPVKSQTGSMQPPSRAATAPSQDVKPKALVFYRQPTGDDLARTYPSRALKMGLSGSATMKCNVTHDGVLTDCLVMSESPLGFGFGQAAISLSNVFRFKPPAGDDDPAKPRTFTTKIIWTLQ